MKLYLILISVLVSLSLNSQSKGIKELPTANSKLPTSSTYAVVIGISDYQDPGIPDLRFADKDAEAFANFLRSSAGGKLDNDHLKLLINSEATMAQFANALDWLWEVCKEGDQAIIYFSGHGDVEKKSLTQPGFLLCWDAPARVYMAGGAFALPMLQEVVSTLSIQNKAKVIVITDACRSGTLAGSSVGGSQATAANLAKQFGNEIKIMSCQPNEYSIEGEQWGGGRGAFSYHLLDALYGMADINNDLWVTLQEIGRYLEDHVTNEVAPVSQVPMTVGNRNERLTSIDEQLLASLKSGKSHQTKMLSAVESKGIEEDVLSKLDTNTKLTYQLFKKALKNKTFLEPIDSCANSYYEQLIKEPQLERLHSTMKRNYAAALQDDAQQVINIWLKADVKELNCIGKSIPLGPIPDNLKKAAELLGTQHYMHSYLTARHLLFEGITQMKHSNPDVLMGNRILEKYKQALVLEPNSPVLWHQMSRVYINNLRNLDSAYLCANNAISLSPQWVLPLTDLYNAMVQIDKLDFAEKVLKQAESIQPEHPYVIQANASLRIHKGDIEGSISAFKAYLEAKGPLYPCWFSDFGFSLAQAGRFEEAEAAYQKALELDSTNSTIMNNLASLYRLLKRQKDAEKWLLKSMEFDSTAIFTSHNLGTYYLEMNEIQKAEHYFKKTLALDSNYISSLIALGEIYCRYFLPSKINEAELLYSRALSLDSASPLVLNSLGIFYFITNRPLAGIEALKKSLNIQPDNLNVVRNLAAFYSQMGEDSLAIDLVNNFLKQNTNPEAENTLLGFLGFIYIRKLNFKKGAEVFEKLVALDSTHISNSNNLAYAYLNLGRYNESEIIFKRILSRDSFHFPSWGNLGEIYLKAGRYEEAEKFLEKSMSLNQAWVYSWTNFGALYLKTHKYIKAEEYLKKALQVDSTFSEPMIYLGHVYLETNRQDEARNSFSNAIRVNPSATNAYLGLASLLAKEGKPKEAMKHVVQAIEINATYEALIENKDLELLKGSDDWNRVMQKHFPEKMK
ncbi:MAG: tetratricopeptide repeat protein [Saprospiraceae bacterium]|nr:tetratricopeptide repeat protein [Saprospiraceae bacterium]